MHNALDVWLKFADDHDDDDDLAECEANTFPDGDRFRIEWYLNAVGLVSSVFHDSYTECVEWYEKNGFEQYG